MQKQPDHLCSGLEPDEMREVTIFDIDCCVQSNKSTKNKQHKPVLDLTHALPVSALAFPGPHCISDRDSWRPPRLHHPFISQRPSTSKKLERRSIYFATAVAPDRAAICERVKRDRRGVKRIAKATSSLSKHPLHRNHR